MPSVPRAFRKRRRFSVSSGVSRICAAPMPCCSKRLLVGMHELHLASCGGGLQVFKTRASLVDAEHGTADRDGAGRNDQAARDPCACSRATSSARPSSQSRLTCRRSSISSDEPTLMTSRRYSDQDQSPDMDSRRRVMVLRSNDDSVTSPLETATVPLRATADTSHRLSPASRDELVDLADAAGQLHGAAHLRVIENFGTVVAWPAPSLSRGRRLPA